MNIRAKRIFTLVELLVVISIIALLASLLLPSLNLAKEKSKVALCTNNLKQCGLALSAYAGDWNLFIPARYDYAAVNPRGWTRKLVEENYTSSFKIFVCPTAPPYRWDSKLDATAYANSDDERKTYGLNLGAGAAGTTPLYINLLKPKVYGDIERNPSKFPLVADTCYGDDHLQRYCFNYPNPASSSTIRVSTRHMKKTNILRADMAVLLYDSAALVDDLSMNLDNICPR